MILETKNLCFDYDEAAILKDLSFKLEKQNICAVFGPNGSGKTTLIKCLAGLLKYQKGEILIDGRDLLTLSHKNISKLIAYIPQEHKPFFPYLVEEVVLMGRNPYIDDFGFGPGKDDVSQSEHAMELAGITHLAKKPYTNLSGGERQLVIIARGIAQSPKVLLLDEPTLNLDFKNQTKIWELIRNLVETQKISALVATHDPNHVLWYCNSAMIIDKGSILEMGHSSDVINKANLNKLYGDIFEISSVLGKKFIMPIDNR